MSDFQASRIDYTWADAISQAIQWLTILPFEITAASITIDFWKRGAQINVGVWIAVFLVALSVIQFFGVRGYGEGMCTRRLKDGSNISTETFSSSQWNSCSRPSSASPLSDSSFSASSSTVEVYQPISADTSVPIIGMIRVLSVMVRTLPFFPVGSSPFELTTPNPPPFQASKDSAPSSSRPRSRLAALSL